MAPYSFWESSDPEEFCCYFGIGFRFALPQRMDNVAKGLCGPRLVLFRPKDAHLFEELPWLSQERLEDHLWECYRVKLSS